MLRAPISARHYRDIYSRIEAAALAGDATCADIKGAIDEAWTAIDAAFRARDYQTDGSDPAEAMIGFLTCYFFESNPSFRAAIPAPVEA
jgi:hypothetical protein